ncbi:hypothetical protein [Pseudoponticoccus marisrubri]|uniref:hypothetical protein n=1 Tax=Pseudoponticoccus marisrubri TaxID=1685382 RepID=UPI0026AB5C02
MDQPTTVGLDLAKNVYQIRGLDAEDAILCRRQLRRSQVLVFVRQLSPCLVGMEACTGAITGRGIWQALAMKTDLCRPLV